MNTKRMISFIVVLAISLSCVAPAFAEKGEVQHLVGVGAFFPAGISTYDKTYLTVACLLVGFQTWFGVSDNWDVGVKLNWSYFNNGVIGNFTDPGNPDMKGDLYFNYQRWTAGALARWNFVPGHSFAPHLFFGGGATFDLYSSQELYTDLLPVKYPDEVKVNWQAQAGLDLQWRFWGPLLVKLEAGYVYSPLSRGPEVMFWFGGDWYIKSTSIR